MCVLGAPRSAAGRCGNGTGRGRRRRGSSAPPTARATGHACPREMASLAPLLPCALPSSFRRYGHCPEPATRWLQLKAPHVRLGADVTA